MRQLERPSVRDLHRQREAVFQTGDELNVGHSPELARIPLRQFPLLKAQLTSVEARFLIGHQMILPPAGLEPAHPSRSNGF